MPYLNQKDYEKLLKDQSTTTGLNIYSGIIQLNEYDNTDWETLQKDYTKMRNGDSVSSSALDVLKLPILNAKYNINLDEFSQSEQAKAAKDFLINTFDNLYDGYYKFIKHCLLSLDFGSSWFEKVWIYGAEYEGKKTTKLIRLNPFQTTSIYEFNYNEQGDFIGIKFKRIVPERGLVEYIDIPKEKLFYYAFDEEFGDVRGRSILRPNRLASQYKMRIMLADARTAERGAGIIRGRWGKDAKIKPEDRQKANSTLNNISLSQNAFFTDQSENFEIDLLQTPDISNIERLKYYDTQAFYNTLSQFMASGVSTGYGSRSTAEVLLTPYELKIEQIMNELKSKINELCYDIINESHLAGLTKQEMPVFSFVQPSKTDINAVASNIINLANAGGIRLTHEDQKYFRQMFGMPELEIKEEEQPSQVKKVAEEKIEAAHSCKDHQKIELSDTKKKEPSRFELSTKYSNECKQIFEFESAEQNYINQETNARNLIDTLYMKTLKDFAEQLAKNPNLKNFNERFMGEWISKVNKIYQESKKKGQEDAKKEISKLTGAEFADSENIVNVNPERRLTLKIENLYNALTSGIKKTIADQTKQSIENQGGVEKFLIDRFQDQLKTLRADIENYAVGGYTAGRQEIQKKDQEKIELYEYVAIMDLNVCEVCAPLDGLRITRQEGIDNGLNMNAGEVNLNPNCKGLLGNNNCRCQLVPVTRR